MSRGSCMWFYFVYLTGKPRHLRDISIASSIVLCFLYDCLLSAQNNMSTDLFFSPHGRLFFINFLTGSYKTISKQFVVVNSAAGAWAATPPSAHPEWPVSEMLVLWLTSPGSGEDFHACWCRVGWRAEDTTEAQAAGGLGWGVLVGGIGEDSFRWTWAWLQWYRSWLGTRGKLGTGRAPRRQSCGGAGWADETLSLKDN